MFGGSLTIPAYIMPEEVSADGDEIPVDNPNWLVLITAAEFIRNDITRQNQYGTLVAEANEAMRRMREDNEGQDTSVYRPWSPTRHLEGDAFV